MSDDAPSSVGDPVPSSSAAAFTESQIAALVSGLSLVRARIAAAAARAGCVPPRLVAVSKFKPAPAVAAAYAEGVRHFGENYVQELIGKAAELPADIAWHFIGQLQSNKARGLVTSVPSLYCVESVDSEKLAALLEKGAAAAGRGLASDAIPSANGGVDEIPLAARPLQVLVQVNTSGEGQKGGVEPGSAAGLAAFIIRECPHLAFRGLMTIGAADAAPTASFAALVAERAAVCAALGPPWDAPGALELSMGMSGDFEEATEAGATSLRVGSAIFGERK